MSVWYRYNDTKQTSIMDDGFRRLIRQRPHVSQVRHHGGVRYCDSCDTPVMLEPRAGHTFCPVCGRAGEAALAPLFIVTGASGAGKTAVLAPLARLLRGKH